MSDTKKTDLKDWSRNYRLMLLPPDDNPKSHEIQLQQFQASALLRMADAAELMAKRHTELIADCDKYKRWYEKQKSINKDLKNTIKGLKGSNTRLKNKLKTYEQ